MHKKRVGIGVSEPVNSVNEILVNAVGSLLLAEVSAALRLGYYLVAYAEVHKVFGGYLKQLAGFLFLCAVLPQDRSRAAR